MRTHDEIYLNRDRDDEPLDIFKFLASIVEKRVPTVFSDESLSLAMKQINMIVSFLNQNITAVNVGYPKMTKVKWTSKRGIGIEEVKRPMPQKQPSWLDRLLQLIKGA